MDKIISVVEENHKGKNVCFISRGSWSDPQIAYCGKLLNYFDVESFATCEKGCDYEPTNEDIQQACEDSLFGYTEANEKLEDFTFSDAMSVYNIIKLR